VSGPRQTVAQFLERWLQNSVKPTTRPRTHETCTQKVRLQVVPDTGNVALVSLTRQHLRKLYAKKLEGGLAPARVNPIHVVLHRSLQKAKRWGLVGRNVAEDVDTPPRGRLDGTDRAFTAIQVAQLLTVIRGTNTRLFGASSWPPASVSARPPRCAGIGSCALNSKHR